MEKNKIGIFSLICCPCCDSLVCWPFSGKGVFRGRPPSWGGRAAGSCSDGSGLQEHPPRDFFFFKVSNTIMYNTQGTFLKKAALQSQNEILISRSEKYLAFSV